MFTLLGATRPLQRNRLHSIFGTPISIIRPGQRLSINGGNEKARNPGEYFTSKSTLRASCQFPGDSAGAHRGVFDFDFDFGDGSIET